MGRESEPQIDKIDRKIRESHWGRRAIAGASGALIGGVGYIANTLHIRPDLPPEARLLLFIPLVPAIIGSIAWTATLKINEEELQSSSKKTSEESLK